MYIYIYMYIYTYNEYVLDDCDISHILTSHILLERVSEYIWYVTVTHNVFHISNMKLKLATTPNTYIENSTEQPTYNRLT